MKVQDLSNDLPFGTRITGLEAAMIDDAVLRAELNALWVDRGVIVFEGMDGRLETQMALSQVFGELDVHPMAHMRVNPDGTPPQINNVRYRPEDGSIFEVDGQRLGSWLPWHSDLIYVDRINRGGILRPVELPPEGGETGFIDQIAAYQLMPSALQARLDDMSVAYLMDLDCSTQKFGQRHDVRLERLSASAAAVMQRADSFPLAIHPAVFEQPGTGRKVLNLSPWFAVGVHEPKAEDDDEVLAEAALRVVRDSATYFHRWKAGDMVLWDNWRMLHCAAGLPCDQSRYMQRTTIAGDYALGRLAGHTGAVDDALRMNV